MLLCEDGLSVVAATCNFSPSIAVEAYASHPSLFLVIASQCSILVWKREVYNLLYEEVEILWRPLFRFEMVLSRLQTRVITVRHRQWWQTLVQSGLPQPVALLCSSDALITAFPKSNHCDCSQAKKNQRGRSSTTFQSAKKSLKCQLGEVRRAEPARVSEICIYRDALL